MLTKADEDVEMRGVVLLDLPDHDSTEVSHHLEVERLVQLADMMVWVLDPQKYADAAIHDRYLKPLAGHKDVMLVVLNHIDTVPEDRRAGMVDDVRRLLEADGLGGVPVLPVSARQGWGIQELRALIAKRVAEKKVTRARLEADVRSAAQRLEAATGTGKVPTLSKERVAALDDAFAEAAGVPTVVKAVGRLDPAARQPRDRLARHGVVLPAQARPAQATPPRPRRRRQGADRCRAHVRAAADRRAARPRRHRGALAGRPGGGGHGAVVGERGPRGLGVPAARPRRPARPRRRRDRPRCDEDPRVGRPRARPAVRPHHRRARRCRLARAPRARLLRPAARAARRPTSAPSRCRPCCCSVGSSSACSWPWSAGWLVALTARSRARAADKRLRDAISEVSEELVVEPIEAELASYATVREGLATALR